MPKTEKNGLILRLTIVFLALTLVNILFFWIATGARQMRLLSEKVMAEITAEAVTFTNQISSLLNSKYLLVKNATGQRRLAYLEKKIKETTLYKNVDSAILIDDESNILFSKTKLNTKTANSEQMQLLFRSLQNREQQNEAFWIDIDSLGLSYTLAVPVVWAHEPSATLLLSREMKSMKKEISDLFRFGGVMIAFVLGIQLIFGFYLYKTVLKPVKLLSRAANSVAEENLRVQVRVPSRSDELSQLVEHFNAMVNSLREKNDRLVLTIDQLQDKDEQIQHELDLGKTIQESTIPQVAPKNDLFQAQIYFAPLQKVSGDFFDFFPLENSGYGIVLADASGHGIPAALITVMSHIFFSEAFRRYTEPEKILAYVNRKLEASVSTPDYITTFVIMVDQYGNAVYSNAAHKPAILFRKETNEIETLDTGGFFVGSLYPEPMPYESKKIKINPGDKLVIYTDGISEAENSRKDQFTDEAMYHLVKEMGIKSSKTIVDEIMQAVDKFQDGTPRFDDYTLMVLDFEGIKESENESA